MINKISDSNFVENGITPHDMKYFYHIIMDHNFIRGTTCKCCN